ncbi:uncharacterized protein BDZ99DRAFT_471342 [Mytilinidion resinicola]|uniref:CENP-S complex, centromere protein X n=1 Tax=Mytilinidion resinicola TaxID=574789 RepID=A0A6A6Z4J4_9PEZI|nr:uncharacterized protein BDZ99DRAFT_471342 [Mytilinidion resinicola]KAF2816062.1 hypothetical protein BDZ99DRAFT_471342 [Mytilinidion resinicola]
MPPKPTSNPVRRKGLAFKPPRPVKAAPTASKPAQRVAPKPAARTSTSAALKKPATSRPSFQNASTIISSSEAEDADSAEDDNDEEAEEEASDDDVEMEDRAQHRTAPAQVEELQRPAVPPPLLARLLHEGFEDPKVKIQREAMSVVGKYVETFVREAVARAAFEREDASGGGVGMGVSDGFLQVEDLEKLAPQLVLDF